MWLPAIVLYNPVSTTNTRWLLCTYKCPLLFAGIEVILKRIKRAVYERNSSDSKVKYLLSTVGKSVK